jgi:hypothetical protein
MITQKEINKPSTNLSHHALYVAASAGNFIVAPCERRPILSIQPDDVKSPPATAARESKTALAGAAPDRASFKPGSTIGRNSNELILLEENLMELPSHCRPFARAKRRPS